MASSGHFGHNWMTWTMPMTWPSFHTHNIRCRKRPALSQTPRQVLALTSTGGRAKVLKVNAVTDTPIRLEGEALEEVESFTYLGSIVDKNSGTDADVKARIGKARAAFHQLNNVWRSSDLGTSTKIRIFNTIVKPVLLYGAETWRTTIITMRKIQTCINTCLRRILKIRWPDTISNQELWQRTRQQPIEDDILQRRWRWIGPTLRKPVSSIINSSPYLEPSGEKEGRPTKKHVAQ